MIRAALGILIHEARAHTSYTAFQVKKFTASHTILAINVHRIRRLVTNISRATALLNLPLNYRDERGEKKTTRFASCTARSREASLTSVSPVRVTLCELYTYIYGEPFAYPEGSSFFSFQNLLIHNVRGRR